MVETYITELGKNVLGHITIGLGDMLELISDDMRWALFLYATKVKGTKYRELGITSAMGNMVKNRKRRVSDDLLERILEKLSAKDLIQLTILLKQWERGETPEWARRLAWLGRRPYEADQLINLLYDFFETNLNSLLQDSVIHFSPDSIRKFESWLRAQDKAERTVRERVRYLKRLVDELGWSIDVYRIIEYLAGLSENARDHYRKALRLYIKFTGRKELLELFSSGWTRYEKEEIGLSINEVLDIIGIASTIDKYYALYLATLLITGLRPKEVKSIRWSDQAVDIDPRIFRLNTTSRTKRAYYAFLTPNLLRLLERHRKRDRLVYWSKKKQAKILRIIRIKYPRFRPYDLRDVNTYILYMNKIDPIRIKLIHGWIPRNDVMMKYYLIKHLTKHETLLEILDTHNKAFKEIDEEIAHIMST